MARWDAHPFVAQTGDEPLQALARALDYLAQSLSVEAIAESRQLVRNTVKVHLVNIVDKLDWNLNRGRGDSGSGDRAPGRDPRRGPPSLDAATPLPSDSRESLTFFESAVRAMPAGHSLDQ